LAEDLGPVRLRRHNGFIELTPALRYQGERGFSLVINEAGSYVLPGKVLGKGKPDLCIKCADHTRFPLVLRNHQAGDRISMGRHKRRFSDILDRDARSEYTGIITVEDAEGPAAFICLKRGGEFLVISRDVSPSTSLFEVFGDSNA